MDNVKDIDHLNLNTEDKDHMDDYVEKFSRLEIDMLQSRSNVDKLIMATNINDRRSHDTVKILSAQQKIMEDMYYLLVEMNNIFGQHYNNSK